MTRNPFMDIMAAQNPLFASHLKRAQNELEKVRAQLREDISVTVFEHLITQDLYDTARIIIPVAGDKKYFLVSEVQLQESGQGAIIGREYSFEAAKQRSQKVLSQSAGMATFRNGFFPEHHFGLYSTILPYLSLELKDLQARTPEQKRRKDKDLSANLF